MGRMVECETRAPKRDPIPSGVRAPIGWVGVELKDTYAITRKIANGGMGAVYEAAHVRLGHRVAVKLLRPDCVDDPELLARFRAEAEIVARLGHPHIVTVLDVDETEDGEPFLVMEYLEGETLARRLTRRRRLPLAEVGRIALQVASALACTHERGVVHRDLKPENVMLLSATGEHDFVKILDFGISKAFGRKLTYSDAVLGTPAYMAPEQVTAPERIDHRADQFALAAMVYEALSGRTPHAGETAADVVTSLLTREPIALDVLMPTLPEDVVSVVMRGLARDPDDRYPNVTELAWALHEAIMNPRIEPLAPPPPTRAPAPSGAVGRARARELLCRAQQSFLHGALDQAVCEAEELVELAVFGGDAEIYAVIARGMQTLDLIFEARVAAVNGRLSAGPTPAPDVELSSNARALLALADGHTVNHILTHCGFPRRDAVRMLAGLLRRKLLC